MENTIENEISIYEILGVIKKHILLLIICSLIGVLFGGVYTYLGQKEYYQAKSSMIVQVIQSNDSTYTNLLTGERLTDTYSEIAKSNYVLEKIKERLAIDITVSQLQKMISVEAVSDTLIVVLTVESESPQLATDAANELVLVVKEVSDRFEGLESVDILDIAQKPKYPSKPNHLFTIVLGGMIGVFIFMIIIFLVEVLENRIRTEKDIEEKLMLRSLGVVPYHQLQEENT